MFPDGWSFRNVVEILVDCVALAGPGNKPIFVKAHHPALEHEGVQKFET
jgi:hypothetical protein